MSRYIDEQRGRFGGRADLRTLGVSASAYYQRAKGGCSARAVEDDGCGAGSGRSTPPTTRRMATGVPGRYCSGTASGCRAAGRSGLCAPTESRAPRGAASRGAPPAPTRAHRRPDLVERDFRAGAPNELWVADLFYLRCWEGLVFFAFVLDAYSRKVVGWQLAGHLRTTLVLDALRMALGTRGPGADVELFHHSDRGSQPGLKRSSQQCFGQGLYGLPATAGPGLHRSDSIRVMRLSWWRLARGAGRSDDSHVRAGRAPS